MKYNQQVIKKDDAVFWMDGNGRWHNAHGPFEHKKTIAYFHSAVKRDAGGFYVSQFRDDRLEKVYFKYEDTAFFVFDVITGDEITLVLNTGKRLRLDPDGLFVHKDGLFMQSGKDLLKFTDRSLLKLSRRIEYQNGRYFFKDGDVRRAIAAR